LHIRHLREPSAECLETTRLSSEKATRKTHQGPLKSEAIDHRNKAYNPTDHSSGWDLSNVSFAHEALSPTSQD
jgi:hypothetical protein